MMISLSGSADSVRLFPSGHLDLRNSFDLRQVIDDVFGQENDIVIDLRQVESIDAAGLSALAGSLRRIRTMGGTVNIANANPRLQWLFGLTGVDRLEVALSDPSCTDAA
jgi:anti-sigma B factor antagonist